MASIPLVAGIEIMRKGAWGAYGLALYFFGQTTLVCFFLGLGTLFLLAGRGLARAGAARGWPIPWVAVAVAVVTPLPMVFVNPHENLLLQPRIRPLRDLVARYIPNPLGKRNWEKVEPTPTPPASPPTSPKLAKPSSTSAPLPGPSPLPEEPPSASTSPAAVHKLRIEGASLDPRRSPTSSPSSTSPPTRSRSSLPLPSGAAEFKPIDDWDEAAFDRSFTTNFKGPYFLIQSLLPIFGPRSSIVINGSVNAHIGMPATSVYGATKAAVISFSRTLSGELISRGIRVNAVSPGPVSTPLYSKLGLSASDLESTLLRSATRSH